MDEQPHAYQCLPLVDRQPVGLAGPLPDRRPRHLGRDAGPRTACASRSTPSTRRRSRASSARGSSRSRPPGCSAPRPAGTSTSRGRATAGSPTATRSRASSRPGGSTTPSPSTGSSSSPARSSSPGARASASSCPSPTPRSRRPRRSRPPSACSSPQAARELIEWYERRRQLVGQEVNVHHLYRKAEGVEDHLHKVGVPAIESILP